MWIGLFGMIIFIIRAKTFRTRKNFLDSNASLLQGFLGLFIPFMQPLYSIYAATVNDMTDKIDRNEGAPPLTHILKTGFFLAKSYMIRTHSQWRDLIKIPMHNQNSNERSMSIQNTNEQSMSVQNTNLKFIIPTTKSVVLKMFKIPTDPIKIPIDLIKIPTDPIKIPADPIKIPI